MLTWITLTDGSSCYHFSDFIVISASTSPDYTALSTLKTKSDGAGVVESQGNHIWIAPDLPPAHALTCLCYAERALGPGSCFELVKGGLVVASTRCFWTNTHSFSSMAAHMCTIPPCIPIWYLWSFNVLFHILSYILWSPAEAPLLVKEYTKISERRSFMLTVVPFSRQISLGSFFPQGGAGRVSLVFTFQCMNFDIQ